jgi:hypothetical protein
MSVRENVLGFTKQRGDSTVPTSQQVSCRPPEALLRDLRSVGALVSLRRCATIRHL